MSTAFNLILIRHAQSENNARRESQRVEDPEITQTGQHQVKLLADRFAHQSATHLFTSAFRRALQTTVPLTTSLGLSGAIRTDLHEVGGCYRGHVPGQLEGRPGLNRNDLAREFPDFTIPDDITEHGWWRSRTYEDIAKARERAGQQARQICSEFHGSSATVVCVIHADFKALLLDHFLGPKLGKYEPLNLVNTGVTHLRFEAAEPEVILMNDASHLAPELVTA